MQGHNWIQGRAKFIQKLFPKCFSDLKQWMKLSFGGYDKIKRREELFVYYGSCTNFKVLLKVGKVII